jgi:hypothetical protein
MNKHMPSRKSMAKQSTRLGAYLAAGLGASTVATPSSDAAIVVINIGPTGFNIGGINGGVASGSFKTINNFPLTSAGTLKVYNDSYKIGLGGISGLKIGYANSGIYATPKKFVLNEVINSSVIGGSAVSPDVTVFRNNNYYGTFSSPNFGPGSYMGFRTSANNYGWLEVTWTNASSQFQILSGAYESVPNVAILAGATVPAPAPVPEPGTWAAAALLAGGAAFARWRRRRDEAQKEAA